MRLSWIIKRYLNHLKLTYIISANGEVPSIKTVFVIWENILFQG